MITIYMATYIITQAARQNTNSEEKLQKQYIKNIGTTTNKVNNKVNNLHPNKKKKSKNKLNNREKIDKGSEPTCQTNTHKKDLEENWETIKEETHIHQITQTLLEFIKENVHPKQKSKNTQKIISRLWKEAIISLYTDNSYKNEIFNDFFNNLLATLYQDISQDNSGTTTDHTNPLTSEPDHPADNADNKVSGPSKFVEDTLETATPYQQTKGEPGNCLDYFTDHMTRAFDTTRIYSPLNLKCPNEDAQGTPAPRQTGDNEPSESPDSLVGDATGITLETPTPRQPTQRWPSNSPDSPRSHMTESIKPGNSPNSLVGDVTGGTLETSTPRQPTQREPSDSQNSLRSLMIKGDKPDDSPDNRASDMEGIASKAPTSRLPTKRGPGASPDRFRSRMTGDTLDNPAPHKSGSSNLGGPRDKCIKHLAATIGASLTEPLSAPECSRNTGINMRNVSMYHQLTKIGSGESLDALMTYLITTLGNTLMGQGGYHKVCNNGSKFPKQNVSPMEMSGHRDNIQP